MIPGDLGAELVGAIRTVIAVGDLPPSAERLTSSGTWRPAPGHSPGSYATSLPFDLARLAAAAAPAAGASPAVIAGRLAELIRPVEWIESAHCTGGGYLTITVTPAALARLAVRIPGAGAACVRSVALRGVCRPGPPLPDLVTEPSWPWAWRDQAAALTGRLAAEAGATVDGTAGQPSAAARRAPAASTSVADAVGYAGADAVRYWLARMTAEPSSGEHVRVTVSYVTTDPWYLVSFAHADAASALRWAADLGLARVEPDDRLAGLLSERAELALLARLSWCGERVAGAARRGRPAELPRYLEEVAGAWLACRESCPALPFGGRAAPRDGTGISARLWLADAARTVLATGLALIGVGAPARL